MKLPFILDVFFRETPIGAEAERIMRGSSKPGEEGSIPSGPSTLSEEILPLQYRVSLFISSEDDSTVFYLLRLETEDGRAFEIAFGIPKSLPAYNGLNQIYDAIYKLQLMLAGSKISGIGSNSSY